MSTHHSSVRRDILSELKAANAILVRTGKHEIWKLPTGAIVTVSVTPRDRRALFNVRSDIRRGLRRIIE